MRRLLLAGPLLLPLVGLAVEPAATASVPASSGLATQLGQLSIGLLVVLGLIFLLAWLLRRVQRFGARGGRAITLLASQMLGPRERLVLVQVGGEQILLGISAGRITPLHVLKEPVHLPETQAASPEFAQRLMELLGRDKH